MQLVAEASNAEQALQLALQHAPDVVLMDLAAGPHRPGSTQRHPPARAGTRVVMMTMHDDAAHVRDALDRGAVGFVVRMRHRRSWNWRCAPRTPASVPESADFRQDAGTDAGPRKPTGIAALSPRQREILRRIGKGESNKEIAADLGISVKTVETHRARMMESLGCRRASDLLLLAARHQHELE